MRYASHDTFLDFLFSAAHIWQAAKVKVERDQQLVAKGALVSEQQVAERTLIRLQEAERAAVSAMLVN